MTPALTIIIPTRERAHYLRYAVGTCTSNTLADLEILVLDNASTDRTAEVVASIHDPRIRYERSDVRLSMRDNFEKGLRLAKGSILCFIGDDDGVMPRGVDEALRIFSSYDVDAVSAKRAHYFWPDLMSTRKNTGLLPRGRGVHVLESSRELRTVLGDVDYYRLPCLYHGFVKTDLVKKISDRQGRFFLSSQVDMYSSIALSSEPIRYGFSESPLIINGGSARSNGASHFGGGTGQEKSMWTQEDDLGFLPGFDGSLTVGSLIVESALRYCMKRQDIDIFSMLDRHRIEAALATEAEKRLTAGRPAQDVEQMYATAGVLQPATAARARGKGQIVLSRISRLVRSFTANRPVDMDLHGVNDVLAAARHFGGLLDANRAGVLANPMEQVRAASRLARSKAA